MNRIVARAVFPFSLAVACAIWARGYVQVGDGFSAGALAGLGAITQYIGFDHPRAARMVGARHAWRLVHGGLLVVLAVLIGPTMFGIAPVTHAPAPGQSVIHIGILALHTALLFDLGVAVLVYGGLVGTFDRLLRQDPGEHG